MAADTTFLSAYLINGEDELKRETVLKRLRERAAKLGDIDFNSDTFDGETATGADIVAACNTVPFASEVRIVVVFKADALHKADSEEIVSYLASPCPTTVLALVSAKLAKNTRLYKAVAAVGPKAVIDCAPLKSWELPRRVREMAVTHGITLTQSAAEVLVELVGENTVHLDAELKKLALAHTSKQSVSDREVRDLVTRSAEPKPWDFTDAFAARDLASCIRLIGQLKSSSPYSLLGMTVNRIREMITFRSHYLRGTTSTKAIAAQMKVPEWKLKNHPAWMRKWTSAQLRDALSSARDCERAMKSRSDAEAIFLDWVISVLAR